MNRVELIIYIYFSGLDNFQNDGVNGKSDWHTVCSIAIVYTITARHFQT